MSLGPGPLTLYKAVEDCNCRTRGSAGIVGCVRVDVSNPHLILGILSVNGLFVSVVQRLVMVIGDNESEGNTGEGDKMSVLVIVVSSPATFG